MLAAVKWVQPEHYKVVGAVLEATRRNANMTQAELARRVGKLQSIISAIEAGTRRVDLVEFLAIVRALGADPVEIFATIIRSLSQRAIPSRNRAS